MGSFSSKTYVKFEDKNIGNSKDTWDAKSCPVAYQLTETQCSQNLSNSATAMFNCSKLTGCEGFDWNPTTNTAYYHTQASTSDLTTVKGQEAFVYETKVNWALIIGIIFGVIALILFIVVLFVAMHHHVKEGIATGKLPPSAAGNLIGK